VRGEVAWVFHGERQSPGRHALKVVGWWLEGTRSTDRDPTRRARRGAFVHLEQESYWGLVEVADGGGMLESVRTPPFATGEVVSSPTGRGWGTVAKAGGRVEFSFG
jgi:hypothetical protein